MFAAVPAKAMTYTRNEEASELFHGSSPNTVVASSHAVQPRGKDNVRQTNPEMSGPCGFKYRSREQQPARTISGSAIFPSRLMRSPSGFPAPVRKPAALRLPVGQSVCFTAARSSTLGWLSRPLFPRARLRGERRYVGVSTFVGAFPRAASNRPRPTK